MFFIKQKALLQICSVLIQQNIPYITLKGIALAHILYDDFASRNIGDLDIYVSPEHFESALNTLYKLNYEAIDKITIYNKHHVALHNGKIIVELHKNILNPSLEICEAYMLSHMENIEIDKYQVVTLDKTASLLHLLYHLYTDVLLACYNIYPVFLNTNISGTKRFLFRAYEIALFSEKYSDEIHWEHIIEDIKCQKLNFVFKKTMHDILHIFPEAFPNSFVETVYNIKYIEDRKRL